MFPSVERGRLGALRGTKIRALLFALLLFLLAASLEGVHATAGLPDPSPSQGLSAVLCLYISLPPPCFHALQVYTGEPVHADGLDSTGAITDGWIDWGDGTLPTPGSWVGDTHAYERSGTYNVTLTVVGADGSTATDSGTVEVLNRPPVADFVFTPERPQAGQSATFDASASNDLDGVIVAYSWDFGDGSNGTGVTVTHAFAEPSNYSVTLTVTDDDGGQSNVTKTVTVLPRPNQGPEIISCSFAPDLARNAWFLCGDPNAPPAYVNTTVGFNVTVRDPEGDNITVTLAFDYCTIVGAECVPNPSSPTWETNVSPSGPNANVSVTTSWTYDRLSNNTRIENISSTYFVGIETRDARNATGTSRRVPVVVDVNSPPVLDGLSSHISAGEVRFPELLVPLTYVNVTLSDRDNDTLTVTWDWGDGTVDVLLLPLVNGSTALGLTHQYSIDQFQLNITPATITFPITVWADDGQPGHNMSAVGTSVVAFDLGYDFPPSQPGIEGPLKTMPWWKVGEVIPMQGRATDPEGQPITLYYWDFDNRTDADGDGNPENDRDALGNVTSHAYQAPGIYYAVLWATDGEDKITCLNENCTEWIDHWSSLTVRIDVRENTAPLLLAGSTLFIGLVDEPLLLRATSIEEDGDTMTVTWDFGDGTPPLIENVSGGPRGAGLTIELLENHTYAAAGFYNLTVRVSDGEATNETTALVFISSLNLPPTLSTFRVLRANLTLSTNNTFLPGETFYLEVNITDPEGDAVRITVDWGDGRWDNATATATDGVYEKPRLRHNYSEPGVYQINVTATDGKVYLWMVDPQNMTLDSIPHTVSRLGPTIIVPPPRSFAAEGPWDWWDYSTLAAVLGIPAFLAGRAVWRNIRERKAEE